MHKQDSSEPYSLASSQNITVSCDSHTMSAVKMSSSPRVLLIENVER
jgi:hypothetical protein